MATIIKGKNRNKPWTVRYFHEARQHERSFRTSAEAKDFRAKFEHDSRERIFVDPRAANEKFGAVAQTWLAHHTGRPKTRETYEAYLRLHILPVFGQRGLAAVARDRDGVEKFLRETLPASGMGVSVVRSCYMLINAIVNDAIKTGRVNQTRLRGIKLPVVPQKAEIVFASRAQLDLMAAAMPARWAFTIPLMRGCGLRLGEVLGVRAEDIRDGTLRLQRQRPASGGECVPLKHRDEEDFRDIPIPAYVMLAKPPGWEGFPPVSHRTYRDHFNRARDAAGLPGSLTPHMLRHAFASVCLAGGVPITDVSAWLGHRNIQVTYGIYGHLVPAASSRGRAVLDEDWGA